MGDKCAPPSNLLSVRCSVFEGGMYRDQFLQAFADAFAARLSTDPAADAAFSNATPWTAIMLGKGERECLLRDAAKRYAVSINEPSFSIHEQWYTLDLLMVSPSYDGTRDYWQTKTLLTIEHENGDDVETEMWKLAHWRSPLSVLVFYDFNESDLTDKIYTRDKSTPNVAQRDWLTKKLSILSRIVSDVDPGDASRHLLLIGNRAASGLAWRYSSWDGEAFGAPRLLSRRGEADG